MLQPNSDQNYFVVQPWKDPRYDSKALYYHESFDIHSFPDKTCALGALEAATSNADYVAGFDGYQKAFAESTLQKAILSRIKVVEKQADFDPLAFFEKLTTAYPKAMISLVVHPIFGMWIGASPEILLTKTQQIWRTVSLASTQPTLDSGEYTWTAKEKTEQELVSRHIRQCLESAGISDFHENGPHAQQAAQVVHLQTEFDFVDPGDPGFLLTLLEALHPTPAVAGLPANEARDLINKTEKHPRKLYTGYLGAVDFSERVNLYVNLRCMHIGTKEIALYVGGGITPDSDLKAEWNETEHKAKTLLNQLHGIRK